MAFPIVNIEVPDDFKILEIRSKCIQGEETLPPF